MKRFLLASFLLCMISACKKEKHDTCKGCVYEGTYTGTIHDVAACYACVPYLDTVYQGSFSVTIIPGDSIKIVRSTDQYEWTFLLNDSAMYMRYACCTVGESFKFYSTDSLNYFYNNGGGGGYFKQEFSGVKQ